MPFLKAPKKMIRLSRRWDLNPRPTAYEAVALPLSYFGKRKNFTMLNLPQHLEIFKKIPKK